MPIPFWFILQFIGFRNFNSNIIPKNLVRYGKKSVALDKPPDFFVHSQAAESESKQFGWYDAKGTAYGPPQSTEREIVRAICVNKCLTILFFRFFFQEDSVQGAHM